ncbi:hypothetical protein KKC_07902 [Listeria fleischmannii subsp. coloradonensis]|nr:hypothetical protein KKC_07902 [Listeria fleischmannii subsp. coloradonensis]
MKPFTKKDNFYKTKLAGRGIVSSHPSLYYITEGGSR